MSVHPWIEPNKECRYPAQSNAFTWSAVNKRGEDTTVPLPSASIACISRFNNRLADGLNKVKANLAASAPPTDLAEQVHKFDMAPLSEAPK